MKLLQKLLLSACALPLIYGLSTGPAVLWVRQPILTARTVSAFDRYDKRLSAYLDFYCPVIWLRNTFDSANSAFGSYERLFQPRLSSQSGLVLGEIQFIAGFYSSGSDEGRPAPKSACDARALMRLHGMNFERGYVFYLPRSEILVAEGTQNDIDMFDTIVSDGLDLTRYAVFFF